MTDCNHDCSSCASSGNCSEENTGIKKAPMNGMSSVKKVIGVVSGKGGVGKSSVTSLLASAAAAAGKKVAILDADITGPSIPKAFGIAERAVGNETMIMPVTTAGGIKVMSINLLLENETDPVVWRGPILGGVVEQFWSDVVWGDIDVMFVDMPPGTGDVALTVYQSLPVDGIVIVTSPQELVEMIVEKAAKMADMMNIPIVGIVRNSRNRKASYGCGAGPGLRQRHRGKLRMSGDQRAGREPVVPACDAFWREFSRIEASRMRALTKGCSAAEKVKAKFDILKRFCKEVKEFLLCVGEFLDLLSFAGGLCKKRLDLRGEN